MRLLQLRCNDLDSETCGESAHLLEEGLGVQTDVTQTPNANWKTMVVREFYVAVGP